MSKLVKIIKVLNLGLTQGVSKASDTAKLIQTIDSIDGEAMEINEWAARFGLVATSSDAKRRKKKV